MKKNRKKVLIFSVVVLAAVLIVAAFFSDPVKRLASTLGYGSHCHDCNVILISIDTLRADHLGTYGYERNTSPYIDRFFKDKSIFNNAISPAPCTKPAVLQYLTGRFVYKWEDKRMAEIFKQNGYKTAAIVSQHIFGFKGSPRKEYSRGFDLFDIQSSIQVDRHRMTARNATEISDKAIHWLQKNSDKGAFFLWLHYFDPHDPYFPPEQFSEFRDKSSIYSSGDIRLALKKAQLADRDQKVWKVIRQKFGYIRGFFWRLYGHIFNERDVENFIGLYDDEIKYTDFEVGRIFDTLKKLNLVENSIIILTSDHGEHLGEGNVWDHCLTLHEREIHVPFMMNVNGSRLGNFEHVDTPVSTLDILPTVLNLTGLPTDSYRFDGVDLLQLSPDRNIFSVWEDSAIIRAGEWKFYSGRNDIRLYNLNDDSMEAHNILKKNEEVARELNGSLDAFLADRLGIENQYKRVVEELKSLGYIN